MTTLDEIGVKYAYNFGKGKLYTGGDKTSLGNNFTKEYEILFEPIRENKLNLLELGVLCGKSIAMWSDYFPNGTIYAIDICLKTFFDSERELIKHSAFKNNNIKLFEKDITNDAFKDFVKDLPTFDIIIDDALHLAKAQYDNFIILFHKLNKGGYYVIEDIVDPDGFFSYFSDIIKCSSNVSSSYSKQNKHYSISVKIEYIQIKQNMVIIKRK